jgi:hypothetical protein
LPDAVRPVWLVHWGPATSDTGSQRTLAIIRHLRKTRPVTFVDVGDRQLAPESPFNAEIDKYVFFGEPVLMSNTWRRTLPDLWVKRHRSIGDRIAAAAMRSGAELLYLCAWNLAPTHPLPGDMKIVWDADAPSVYHSSRSKARSVHPFARAHSAWLASRYRRFERSLGDCVDRLSVPGLLDEEALRTHGFSNVSLVPNEVVAVALMGLEKRFDFGFLGSKWAPNADGLRWFLHDVWPAVLRTHPAATLAVAGTVPVPQTRGVIQLGRVDDKAAFYGSVSAIIAPVDYGSGTQMKLLEIAGLPTPIFASSFSKRSTGLTNMTSFESAFDWAEGLRRHLDGERGETRPASVPTVGDALDELLEELS